MPVIKEDRMINRLLIKIGCFMMAVGIVSAQFSADGAEHYDQVPGVIHVHSTYSSGRYGIPELVTMAQSSGVEALVITDHDWVAMEYGLPPLRRLLKVRKERPSVLKSGADRYLNQIDALNALQKKVVLIPGIQSSPFYYWTGNPVAGNLTANDYRKELIAVGMSDIADYERLPVLHRTCFTAFNGKNLIYCLIALLMLGWGGWRMRTGRRGKAALVVMGVAVLVLINFHPFSNSGYDPYHGPDHVTPYQDFIDYVQECGGMTFWSHPESSYSASGRSLGPIQMQTKPYPDMLLQTIGYNGFAAVYGDSAVAHNPGMHWDEVLFEYSNGLRDRPIWAIAEADYHGTRKGERLDKYLTVFLVKEKTQAAVLDAMKKGRMYVVLKQGTARPILDAFSVTDCESGRIAFSGQTLLSTGRPEISGRLSVSDENAWNAEVLIIRNGKTIKAISEQTPFGFDFRDMAVKPGNSVYRIEARIKNIGKILSNPIFVDQNAAILTAGKKI